MSTATTARGASANASGLSAELARWYAENSRPGWRLRWRRRAVWGAQVAQKLGMERETVAPLFFGERMRVVTGERVSSGLLAFGYSECALTALLLGILRPGDTVVDVGTHFGYEALLASHLVGPTGAVYAFEPNPVAFRLASANLRAHRQCRLAQAAAGDAPGRARLNVASVRESAFGALGGVPTARSVDVPVTTVDEALDGAAGPIRVLKVDAEGYELPVLRGAQRTIARHRPLLVLELGMRGETNVEARLRELMACVGPGFEPFDFEYDGTLRVGPVGTLPVSHANVAVVPAEMRDEIARLGEGAP